MKKLLIGTTALVAAGIFAAPAMAADPIKLGLGGKMTQWAGWASQDAQYESGTTAGGTGVSNREFDVKGNSEVYFSGATKLDNGLSVYIKMELEADRRATATESSIDNSFMVISSPTMGKIVAGSVAGSGKAPDVSYGGVADDVEDWITAPAGVSNIGNSVSFEDTSRIHYQTPTFGGFNAKIGYVPAIAVEGGGQPVGSNGGDLIAWYLAANYDANFDGVVVSLAVQRVAVDHNVAASTKNDWLAWRGQGSVSVAGFTLGGEFRDRGYDSKTASTATADGLVYKIGAGYETGPYHVTVTRYIDKVQGANGTAGDDKTTLHTAALAYNMGGGIKAIASYTDFDYENEGAAVVGADNNGSVMAFGISAAF